VVENSFFNIRRKSQARYWMHESIDEQLKKHFYHNVTVKQKLHALEKNVLDGKISSFDAARELLDEYFSKKE
jgi:LAO/AO transport system kinase